MAIKKRLLFITVIAVILLSYMISAEEKCKCATDNGVTGCVPAGCLPETEEITERENKCFCATTVKGEREPPGCLHSTEDGFDAWCKSQGSSDEKKPCYCAITKTNGVEKREPAGCMAYNEEGFDEWCKTQEVHASTEFTNVTTPNAAPADGPAPESSSEMNGYGIYGMIFSFIYSFMTMLL